ncbi:MAG: tRNA lysidine(34) synthetase TilS [bacterium]
MNPPLELSVRRTIERERLLDRGDRVLVAVSGGADSIALLRVLHEISGQIGCTLRAATLDHALRPDSEADADFTEATCRSLGVPCHRERVDWDRLGGAPIADVEARARAVRYEFLRRTAAADGATIAVGHHADDRLETFLIQLLRGAGPRGLSLPRYRREDGVIRPLLDVTRDEIETWLRERGLTWRDDPTNRDRSNLRSRLRADVIPALRRENPAVARVVGRAATLLGETDDLLEALAEAAAEALVVHESPGELVLDGPRAATYDANVLTTLLRLVVRARGVSSAAIGRSAWREVVVGWQLGVPFVRELPGGIRVSRTESQLRLEIRRPDEAGFSVPVHELSVPGRVRLSGPSPIGAELHLTVTETAPPEDPRRASGPRIAWVDAGRIVGGLAVRTRRSGDRYRPLGLDGSVKVQDLLVDRKIPRPWRDSVPVVTDHEGIVWIPGFRVDRRSRITEETQRAYRIELIGRPPWMDPAEGAIGSEG